MRLLIVHTGDGDILSVGIPVDAGVGLIGDEGQIISEIEIDDMDDEQRWAYLHNIVRSHRVVIDSGQPKLDTR
jgi:hypothetical protein